MQNLIRLIKGDIYADEPKGPAGTWSDPPSSQDVYRYRKQRGVNLGSWFVLERWITETPFNEAHAAAPAQSDLDVAKGERAKEALERHWDSWIGEQDWEFMKDRGINSVRIPIGYYHLCGADPGVLEGTDFQPFFEIYRGAWARLTKAVKMAAAHDMGVLLDLHAAPGKQNNDPHAGTSDRANFFGDPHNQRCTVRALCSLLRHMNEFTRSCNPPLQNIIGIELLNEPNPPWYFALEGWYKAAIEELRHIDSTIPIYLGECWRPEAYAEWLAWHPSPADALTVLDHHLYRCFTSSDNQTAAETHAGALRDPSASTPRMLESVSEKVGRAGGGVILGEWSGGLNPSSLRGTPDEQKNFINAQLNLFERSCAGWFFWTYRKQWKGDTGWSWRDACEKGVFPTWVGIRRFERRNENEEDDKAALKAAKDKCLERHTQYWVRYPGSYDHSFFEAGFMTGWNDAYAFFNSTLPNSTSVNQIGFTRAWARRRAWNAYRGEHYWEYETGFLQAVDEATINYTK